jgi:hypothetical protein
VKEESSSLGKLKDEDIDKEALSINDILKIYGSNKLSHCTFLAGGESKIED